MFLDALVVPEHEALLYAVKKHAILSLKRGLQQSHVSNLFWGQVVFTIVGTTMYLAQTFRTHPTALANLSISQHGNAVECRIMNKSRCKDVEPELLRAHTAALQQDLSERAREFHGKVQP